MKNVLQNNKNKTNKQNKLPYRNKPKRNNSLTIFMIEIIQVQVKLEM